MTECKISMRTQAPRDFYKLVRYLLYRTLHLSCMCHFFLYMIILNIESLNLWSTKSDNVIFEGHGDSRLSCGIPWIVKGQRGLGFYPCMYLAGLSVLLFFLRKSWLWDSSQDFRHDDYEI